MGRSASRNRDRRLLVLAALLTVTTAGCFSQEATPTEEELRGIWAMETFTLDGEEVPVVVGENAARPSYIHIGTYLSGVLGCNGFGQDPDAPYAYEAGELTPNEVIGEAALCTPETLMESEDTFGGMLFESRHIEVRVVGEIMTWKAEGETLTFARRPEAPAQEPVEPSSFGPLVCAPASVMRERIPLEGTNVDAFLHEAEVLTRSHPGVETVERAEPSGWVWFGYDSAGETVVGVALDDVTPHTFSVYTCP